MSGENKNNTLVYGIVGVGALLIAGAAVYYATKEEDVLTKQVLALGELKYDEMGGQKIIDFDQYNALMKLVKDTIKETEKDAHKDYMKERGDLFKASKWTEYETLIQERQDYEQTKLSDLKDRVAGIAGTTAAIFDFTQAYFEKDPMVYQAMIKAQATFTEDNDAKKPKLSREETLKCFKFLEEEKTNSIIEAINSGDIDKIRASGDAKQSAFFMSLQSAKAADKLLHEMEVSEEECNMAFTHYKLSEDPSITRVMQGNMIRMQTAKMQKSNWRRQIFCFYLLIVLITEDG